MADALKALGQDVHKEAPHELLALKSFCAFATLLVGAQPRSGNLMLRVRVGRPVKFHYSPAQHEPEQDDLPCVFATQAR